MGKLRNSGSDVGQFMQWMGRKIRNHNPLEELKMDRASRDCTANIYGAKERGRVYAVKGDDTTLVCVSHGRCFVFTAREEDPKVIADLEASKQLVPVGH